MKSYFSERLKLIREQRGLTLDDIAMGIQSDKSTLSQYETGKRRPNHEMIIKVSEYLGVSADYLLGLTDKEDGKLKSEKMIKYHQLSGMIREFFSDSNTTQADKDSLFKDVNNIYWKYKG